MQVLSTLTEIQTAIQIMHQFIILGRLCSVATPWSLGLCNILALEPSAVHVTNSYSRPLPAIERFYRETKFSLLKSTHSINLESQIRQSKF